MTSPRRIGLLGGTFDPVHIAHLHIAACAAHDLRLDEVRFIPAGAPPHKPGAPVTDGKHRQQMLKLATAETAQFIVDPIDLGTGAPSYTSELLTRIHERNASDHLWFIVGGDSLVEFHTWHEPERILSLARMAVADRPGWTINEALSSTRIHRLREHVDLFSSVPVALSATVIRNRLATNEPVDWLVPRRVLAYIRAHGLYEHTPDNQG